jgi:predicted RNase H-like nuclease
VSPADLHPLGEPSNIGSPFAFCRLGSSRINDNGCPNGQSRDITEIHRHLQNRPPGVAKDDLLDAAVAAWTALRISNGEARRVCDPEQDEKGLETTIWY